MNKIYRDGESDTDSQPDSDGSIQYSGATEEEDENGNVKKKKVRKPGVWARAYREKVQPSRGEEADTEEGKPLESVQSNLASSGQ